MQVMCAGCKQQVEINEVKPPQVFNLPAVSLLVLEHAEQPYCANCRAPVTVQVVGLAGLQLVAVPVAPEAQKKLIVVPGRVC
jgi:hypothetical protein